MELVLTNGAPQNYILNGLVSVTFTGQLMGTVTAIDCSGANTSGTLIEGTAASGISTSLPYTGGNTGPYGALSVASSGVTGLTANLAAGTFANGAGNLSFNITGTPASGGAASFALSIGGQSCSFTVNVAFQYPAGTIHCTAVPTAIVDVTNPTTGKIWMDRNLGASQVATSSTNALAYGDLYQWGRRADGHQCRNSPTTMTLSSVDQPAHGSFILAINTPFDWRNPQNDNLWQGVNGVNNPCPIGYRVPTEAEFDAESLTWTGGANATGAIASPLKLTQAGHRDESNGSLISVGTFSRYWSSTIGGTDSRFFAFDNSFVYFGQGRRARGGSIRCIKN